MIVEQEKKTWNEKETKKKALEKKDNAVHLHLIHEWIKIGYHDIIKDNPVKKRGHVMRLISRERTIKRADLYFRQEKSH